MATNEDEYEYNSADLDAFLTLATKLAKEAGTMISDAMEKGRQTSVATKTGVGVSGEGTGSSVLTETDLAVEKHIVSGIREAFPDHCFIGEEDISASESGMVETFSNKPTWIIDPIDGTMNFVHRNPLVCTSIGLAINK